MKKLIISVCFKGSQTKDKNEIDAGKIVNWYNLSGANYGNISRPENFFKCS